MVIDMHDIHIKYTLGIVLTVLSFSGLLTHNVYATETRGISIEKTANAQSTNINKGVYRALIIGNNEYQDEQGKWKSLSTAITDAREVARLLKQHYGFTDIKLLENATRRDVLFALEDLANKSLKNDNVLIYYAGHGFLDDETNKGFWVPVDADGSDHTTFLRNSTIRDEVSSIASRVQHTLLISDSCFSGSLLRTASRSISEADYTEKYFEKVSNKKSVQIMAAGGFEFVDDDYRESGHSPFTYFLINELKTNNSPMLTVSQLSGNVERAVANNVDQVPESGVLQGAGDELGEFIFIKLDVTVEGVDPDKMKVEVNVIPVEKTNDAKKVSKQPAGQQKVVPIPTL
jgi:Caspase domain